MPIAKPTESAPLGDFRALGAQVIGDALDAMLAHSAGVRTAEDIESVHQMRVASRRLRAALSIFHACFPGRAFARFEADVKAVTDALGAARDLDVMIEALEELEAKMPEGERAGMDSFLERQRRERERLQKEVVRAMNLLDKSDLRAAFAKIAAKSVPRKRGAAHG